MTPQHTRSVEESLIAITTDVEEMLGVDVAETRIDRFGCVYVRIDHIGRDVWQLCPDPTFGVDRASSFKVNVIDGCVDTRLPANCIEIELGQLFPEQCGPRTLDV